MSEEYSIPPELFVTVTRTASHEKKTREALWENKIIFGSYMALARPWQLLLDKTSMLSPRMAPPNLLRICTPTLFHPCPGLHLTH